ncbi:F0F1 ATP synthase subunit delta [Legionella spiritensis]|uniref:ATP synthase subunit delta n=1 Tax=Legionella spiritensis TaxID=452 RepID=A0A0W0ZC29_LEGSP|nr:F0F1 ATP synthase subunit delta [Legionella spiritensis]KTD66358.1 ATP synthase F1 subunit delta [Legionella spiritensis]SNV48789.1 ATP synthase F1 subunit delta [Legionella spiritensis]VEG91570.1 ATP synthase F1 subunit delta [Legionella spiritensis]
MSETITVARPYAKAIFEYALDKGKLSEWSEILMGLSHFIFDQQVVRFINNPVTTVAQKIALMTDPLKKIAGTEQEALTNFISELAHNKRLMALPDIQILFEAMRAEQEKTITVHVTSYSKLDSTQERQFIDALSQRLKCQVTLKTVVDPHLLGGAIIQAGDLVIDGSVRGKLNKLGADLAA